MCTRYPNQVDGHNLVCPLLLLLWIRVPVWDHLCFGHDGGRCAFGRNGATRDYSDGKRVGVAERVSW